jgi:hypothetical protein
MRSSYTSLASAQHRIPYHFAEDLEYEVDGGL